jgi:hypothetical protein
MQSQVYQLVTGIAEYSREALPVTGWVISVCWRVHSETILNTAEFVMNLLVGDNGMLGIITIIIPIN